MTVGQPVWLRHDLLATIGTIESGTLGAVVQTDPLCVLFKVGAINHVEEMSADALLVDEPWRDIVSDNPASLPCLDCGQSSGHLDGCALDMAAPAMHDFRLAVAP